MPTDGVAAARRDRRAAPGGADDRPGDPARPSSSSHGYRLSLGLLGASSGATCRGRLPRRRLGPARPRPVGPGLAGVGHRSTSSARTWPPSSPQAAPEGPLVLVGHSMGGMTMMALAADAPRARPRAGGRRRASSPPAPAACAQVSCGPRRVLGKAGATAARPAASSASSRRGQTLVNAVLRRAGTSSEFLVDRYSFASPVPRARPADGRDAPRHPARRSSSHFMPTFDSHDKREALARSTARDARAQRRAGPAHPAGAQRGDRRGCPRRRARASSTTPAT